MNIKIVQSLASGLLLLASITASYSQEESPPRRAGVRYGDTEIAVQYFPYVGAVTEGGSWGVVLGAALWAQHPVFLELQHFPHGDIQDAQAFIGAHYSLKRTEQSVFSVLVKGGPRFTLEFAEDVTYYDYSGFAFQPGVSYMIKFSDRALLSGQLGWKYYTQDGSDSEVLAMAYIGFLF